MTEFSERVRKELSSRYRIERELGRGGTATVYLAEDIAQQREVAVKVLHPELVQAVGGRRFLREIRVAASLNHPHLLAIHDSGEINDVFYYVTPYLPDGSLRARLERERQLAIDESLRIVTQVADALAYVHSNGVMHRDVKPENILFASGYAYVADFGIARAIDNAAGDTLTSTGLVVGTPAYMSPEQASGERVVDARSDQYSLACVLYEMITGMPPFIGPTAQSVIAQRFAHAALPASHYRPGVPAHIEHALAKALSLAPADRFASIADFLGALKAEPIVVARPAETRASRRLWFAAGIATAVVVLTLVGFNVMSTRFTPTMAEHGTLNARAARAFERATEHVEEWRLAEALSSLDDAVSADPAYARARLWRAQLRAFADLGDTSSWMGDALRVHHTPNGLSAREKHMSNAVFALAERRYPDACDAYDALTRHDSLDALAWYGQGECRVADSVVVRGNTPSGSAFRSSFHAAANAYLRAVQIEPRVYALPVFERLRAVLKTQPRETRLGYSEPPAHNRFLAYALLYADTLAFVPYPAAAMASGAGDLDPAARSRALERNRRVLLAASLRWAKVFPQTPAAYAAVAETRERNYDLGPQPPGELSALTAIQRARRLSNEPVEQASFTAAEVRLRIKRGEFRAASELADSALTGARALSAAAAAKLRGLALLTGRLAVAERLQPLAEGEIRIQSEPVPRPVSAAVWALQVRAALGQCADFDERLAELAALVDRYTESARSEVIFNHSRGTIARDAVTCTAGRSALWIVPPYTDLAHAQRAYARGDRVETRRLLERISTRTRGVRPGEIAIDNTLQHAWLLAALGDTAGAIRLLDLSLTALPTQSPAVLDRLSYAAALPRAMLLRAEQALAAGDLRTAQYWAGVVDQLWARADAPLRATVQRLQARLRESA